eukprot:m.59694 g.59694  ORF g.59694 m.59694 type:complete len:398 (+) comp11264_c0_seq1:259-1452(+)
MTLAPHPQNLQRLERVVRSITKEEDASNVNQIIVSLIGLVQEGGSTQVSALELLKTVLLETHKLPTTTLFSLARDLTILLRAAVSLNHNTHAVSLLVKLIDLVCLRLLIAGYGGRLRTAHDNRDISQFSVKLQEALADIIATVDTTSTLYFYLLFILEAVTSLENIKQESSQLISFLKLYGQIKRKGYKASEADTKALLDVLKNVDNFIELLTILRMLAVVCTKSQQTLGAVMGYFSKLQTNSQICEAENKGLKYLQTSEMRYLALWHIYCQGLFFVAACGTTSAQRKAALNRVDTGLSSLLSHVGNTDQDTIVIKLHSARIINKLSQTSADKNILMAASNLIRKLAFDQDTKVVDALNGIGNIHEVDEDVREMDLLQFLVTSLYQESFKKPSKTNN